MDGAKEIGQPASRSLPGPSPSANLAGNWKGDPLESCLGGFHLISHLTTKGAELDCAGRHYRRRQTRPQMVIRYETHYYLRNSVRYSLDVGKPLAECPPA